MKENRMSTISGIDAFWAYLDHNISLLFGGHGGDDGR